MKTNKFYYLIVLALVIGVTLTYCKKDKTSTDTTSTGLSTSGVNNNDVAITQDNESQDAVADQVENDADNIMDDIESNGYPATKSAADQCVSISIDKPDTINFPKTITLTYNCTDTVNSEIVSETGILSIKVELLPGSTAKTWKNFLKRTITFTNFKFGTDSSSITINGSRIVKRISTTSIVSGNTRKVTALDSIVTNLNFLINYGTENKTVTRIVAKTRSSVLNFARLSANANWVAVRKSNSVTWNGSVSGVNAKGDNYSRVITTPIVYTYCSTWPYNPILTGVMTFSIGSDAPFTITYSANECRTKATLSRNGVTVNVTRKLGLGFKKWW
jgi:hypothetical protein